MNPTTEPISLTEAVRLLVLAVLAGLTAFGAFHPTPEQTGAILGLIAAGSVVLSIVARQRSTPTAKVALTTDQVTALQPPPPEPVTAAEVLKMFAEHDAQLLAKLQVAPGPGA